MVTDIYGRKPEPRAATGNISFSMYSDIKIKTSIPQSHFYRAQSLREYKV